MILASLRLLVVPGPNPTSAARTVVSATVDTVPDLVIEATPVDGLTDSLKPGGSEAVQVVYGRFTVGLPGEVVELWPCQLSSWSVSRSMAGATFSFTLPAVDTDGVSVLGRLATWEGAIPGKAPIHVDLIHETPAGELVAYRQIHDGIAMSSGETVVGGISAQTAGMDRFGRYDKCKVNYSLEPRHRKTQGTIIAELAAAGGYPDIAVGAELGSPRLNPLDVACSSWLPPSREAARSTGHALFAGTAGELLAVPYAPEGPTEWTFGIEDVVLAGDISITGRSDSPVCITVTGSVVEQAGGDGGDGLGSYTTQIVTTVFERYAVKRAWWRSPSGSLADAPLLPGNSPLGAFPEKEIITQRTTFRVTKRRGCTESEWTQIESFTNPKSARYLIGTDGEPVTVALVFSGEVYLFNEDAEAGDTSEAFQWPEERFRITSVALTKYRWGDGGGDGGPLTQKQAFSGEWFNPEIALKERLGTAEEWADRPYREVRTDGGGKGVYHSAEKFHGGPRFPGGLLPQGQTPEFIPIDRWGTADQSTYRTTAAGSSDPTVAYKLWDKTEEFRWTKDGGAGFLFQDGSTSRKDVDGGFIESTTQNRYQAISESNHFHTVEERGIDGRLTRRIESVPVVGAVPAAEACRPSDVDRASRRPVEGKACVDEGCHQIEVANRFIESNAEATALAKLEVLLAGPLVVTIPILPSGALRPGMPVNLNLPSLVLVGRRGVIDKITWSQAARGAGGAVPHVLGTAIVHVTKA